MLTQEDKDNTLKRLGAFAGMLEDCSAIVVLHVNERGDLKYHRSGNLTTLVGAAAIFEKALRDETADGFNEWDPDEDTTDGQD